MTIVARFLIHNHPVLLGDVLLRGWEQAGRSLKIPTVGDTRSVYPEGSGIVIAGLNQKVNLLRDNLVVGWAGSRSIAKTVLKQCREQNIHTPFTLDSLQSFFKSCEAEIKNQPVGFAGYLRGNNSEIAFFNFRFNAKDVCFKSDLFGDVCLLGSERATDAVRGHLESFRNIPEPRLSRGGKANAVEVAIPFALRLSGLFLEDEMRTYESLYNYYGGGYEVATLRRRTFSKVDDLTYLFWYAEIDGGEIKIKPHKAFKYKYYGDLLAIRALSLKDSDAGSISFDDSTHLIEPVYRYVTEEEVANFVFPDMNSKFICNYFLVYHPDHGWDVFTKIDYSHDADPRQVIFKELKGGLAFGFKGEFLQEVITSIRKRFSAS